MGGGGPHPLTPPMSTSVPNSVEGNRLVIREVESRNSLSRLGCWFGRRLPAGPFQGECERVRAGSGGGLAAKARSADRIGHRIQQAITFDLGRDRKSVV